MARTHVQPGVVIDDFVADKDYTSGALVKFGALAAVALGSIATGATGSIMLEEVFTVAKKTTDVISRGQQLYLDAANNHVTTADDDGGSPATPFIKAGKAISAAGNGATTVQLKLNV